MLSYPPLMTLVQGNSLKRNWESKSFLQFSIEYKKQFSTRLTYKEYYAA
jgi:hypothetical protein